MKMIWAIWPFLWLIQTSLPSCMPIVLAAGFGGEADNASKCSWLNPKSCSTQAAASTPVLGLVFLHMRKAGGTHILHFLSEWLRSRGCLDRMGKQTDIEGHENVVAGRISHRIPYTSDIAYRDDGGLTSCPHVHIFHNEYYCLSGDMVLNYPPMKELENKKSYKLLTVLRDPIERIGSQFFHTPECYGRRHILETVLRECGTKKYLGHCRSDENRGIPRTALCSCIYNATKSALNFLQRNEAVWFDWLTKSEKGFMEQHIDNYYIKRLASVPSFEGRPRYVNLLRSNGCLRGGKCFSLEPFTMLEHSTGFHPCLESGPTGTRYDDERALIIAKQLLKDHFHFFITEFYDSKSTIKNIVTSVLDDPSAALLVERGKWSQNSASSRNGQIKLLNKEAGNSSQNSWSDLASHKLNSHVSSGRYRLLMPDRVARYIMEQNTEDYELYNYARQLYQDRYGT